MDNTLKIINYLGKNINVNFTMHQLSKLLKIPYASFYRTVQELDNLLTIREIGKAKIISLNTQKPVIKSYLTISSYQEKKEYLLNQPIIKKIINETKTNEIIILFGSYAKHKYTESSDIDLMIINKEGKKSLSFSKYELLFKKKINPIFITKKEFKAMLKDEEENVGKQALKNHIVLNNPESFWGCAIE